MHLYLHIPFCKQACHYCDFHFSTNRTRQTEMIRAMCREISLQANYLPTRRLETVYFGGGTPSLLSEAELGLLFETIHRAFTLVNDAQNRPPEITLEANPDDLSPHNLRLFRQYVNRLSIGIQSFDEEILRWMNRAHTATEAQTCVRHAQDAGFDNMSVDLMYGIPAFPLPSLPLPNPSPVGKGFTASGAKPLPTGEGLGRGVWQHDLAKTLALNVSHISAYCLTIEPDTVFARQTQKKQLRPVDDGLAADQMADLTAAMTGAGYDHYEISSFARPGQYARHNTAYWQQRPYLGVGPGAHSYNGHSRQFNLSNNALYVKVLTENKLPATTETLTHADRVNEYLLTGLRTKWGCSLSNLTAWLGADFARTQHTEIGQMQSAGWLTIRDETLLLTAEGQFFADRVAASLFVGV